VRNSYFRYSSWPSVAIVGLFITAVSLACASEPRLDPSSENVLQVVFFYSPTCAHCQEAKAAVAACEERFAGRIAVTRYDTSNVAAFARLFAYEDHYGSDEDELPKVFVGRHHIAGGLEIARRLENFIAEELAAGSVTFCPADESGGAGSEDPRELPSELLDRFESFGPGAVAVAGLVDGVNPCAFTTIIFLLSVLALLGKSRRQLAMVGIGFTLAVFATYMLLGLGLFGAIKVFSVSHGISTVLGYAVASLAFVLAGWSLIDFARYARTGDTGTVTLGLPTSIKSRIHNVIRRGLDTRSLLVGSIGVGFLVSLLESLCTGQVYLPTLVFVARSPGMRTSAIGYLLLYNAMFILPLIAILGVSYFGVSSQRLGEFLRQHLGALKLAMAFLFAGLGLLVLATS